MKIFATSRILLQVFGAYRKHLVVLVVLGFLSALLEGVGVNIAIPLLSSLVGGVSNTPLDTITRITAHLFSTLSIPFTFRYILGFILVLLLLRSCMVVCFAYVKGWISATFTSSESQLLFRGTLNANWSFLAKQKIGYVQATLVRDIQRTVGALEVLAVAIQSLTGFLMYLLVAFNISPITTLYTVLGGGVLVLFVTPFVKRLKRMWGQLADSEKDISQFLAEHIIGIKVLKASGVNERAFLVAQKLLLHMRQVYIQQILVRTIPTSLFQPASIVFVTILFLITYNAGEFNIVSFAVLLYLVSKIFTYLESGQSTIHSFAELMPYVRNILAYKVALGAAAEHATAGAPFSFSKSLEVRNVSFAHADRKEVLHNVSFFLSRNETLGIIGPSGAGKTSVADILLRLFDPTRGELLVDRISAHNISLESWRNHMGYVSQDIFILNGTIEENVRFYREGISDADIIMVLREANALSFVEELPHGVRTIVGDRGLTLSGGQRQRIALARALVTRPDILVLDEATSALDHESEQLIQESIKKMHGHTAIIIIAHRPSSVAHADRILVLDKGSLVEQGTPEELLRNQGSYFYAMQHRS
jgi:ABC-type multidrug transport system fused ATPase/permease subunit